MTAALQHLAEEAEGQAGDFDEVIIGGLILVIVALANPKAVHERV